MSALLLRDHFIQSLEAFLAFQADGVLSVHLPQSTYLHKPGLGTHFHHTPELFLQVIGSTDFSGHDYHFELGCSEVAVIPRGLPHAERAQDSDLEAFSGIVCCFRHHEVYFLKSFRGHNGLPKVEKGLGIRTESSARIVGHLDEMTQVSQLPDTLLGLQQGALLTVVLSSLLDLLIQDRDMDRSRAVSSRVAFCQSRVSACLEDPSFTVRQLAQELNCSADYLNRKFKAETGSSLNKYLRQERIQYAITSMRHPHLNLSEIAQLSGFSSLNYFSRAFKQSTGITPMEYRKSRGQL